jgi:putative SOS response-associated peptidase YedK
MHPAIARAMKGERFKISMHRSCAELSRPSCLVSSNRRSSCFGTGRETGQQDGERVARQDMLWGFSPFKPGAAYGTNFRTLKNHLWRDWLDREHHCVVSATAFSEPDKNTPKGAVVRR